MAHKVSKVSKQFFLYTFACLIERKIFSHLKTDDFLFLEYIPLYALYALCCMYVCICIERRYVEMGREIRERDGW